ncbi:MAG: carbon-nitrogen hydrolase family protein [Balneolaceae bacterium]|nr:carbon-nitrogen hydrolase family protein [Balneolaceae bacterium]MBO6547260.1 carbon-nitrogen hydrolase family protein [Balneolaceae bacterium]MBO6647793.1 carbon-nitrogen hydrolase family protein [Balneolaceae bacterium]
MDHSYSIAVIQQPPVFLNLPESISLAKKLVHEAIDHGARLIVFPETWLPGYPVWLDYAPNVGVWGHPPAKALFKLLVQNSLSIDDEHFKSLNNLAVQNDCIIVMGAHEKVGRTLYNTIFYFKPDGTYSLHRKLIPTYTERLIWGMGDGSTLSIIEDENVKIGGLVCWEHWMPLARAAMHQLGEHIHIAQWPMVKDLHHIASRQYAFEAQCYVIAAGCTITKQQMLDGIKSTISDPDEELALELIESIPVDSESFILNGGSAVINPDTSYLSEPVYDKNSIIYADLDIRELSKGNLFLDTSGHYSRPDVFQLTVDTRSKTNVTFEH